MNLAIEDYLDKVLCYANREPSEAEEIRRELAVHLDQKVEELIGEGRSKEDAVYLALRDHGDAKLVGYRLRRRFPLLDVRTTGTARGVIAVGPRAVGVFAVGGTAVGVFAFGGLSVGVVGIGGICLCLLFAWAGAALVPLGVAYAGIAVGLVAIGGVACGLYAAGAIALSVMPPADFPDLLASALRSKHTYIYLTSALGLVFVCSWVWGSWLVRKERLRVEESTELIGW